MRSTQLKVTLPDDMAQMVKDKVASGEYASESEVILDGLYALQEHESPHEGDPAFEHWLREVIASYDEVKADPSRTLTIEQVREHLAAKRSASA
ncbi:ribbon-helix-helix domain-containing protein [Phyllobacterium leguminum]|uniref:Putative addiction module CopG family antidote n=1 Tax=Phyllobacterium leguminum TaxID=314237 RepID=A0A318STP1_9HYPH|nr:type II toxin-antitoxin system ParD family antitoxin [Phyllobacterium leguminum]PYE85220.1 putative addiction module CopG family antidote [Phyllobacterium leguminum]